MRPLRNTGRRLATVAALACGMLAVVAPAAFANHVTGVTASGCSSLTYSYVGFSNSPNNTVKMTVLDADGTTVNNTATGSFNGPSGTTTIPIIGGINGEVVIPQATWNTNGSIGSYNTTKPYSTITLSCPVTYTGDAYNTSLSALGGAITVGPVNQVGPVSTMAAVSPSSDLITKNLPGLLALIGSQLDSSVTTGSGSSTVATSVNSLAANPLGLAAISTAEIQDTSTTSCDVSTGKDSFSGSTTIATLTIGGQVIVRIRHSRPPS